MTQEHQDSHNHDDHGHGDHAQAPEPNLDLLSKALHLIGIIGLILSKTVFAHDTSLLSFIFNPIAMLALIVVGVLTFVAKNCCCKPESAHHH